MSSKTVTISECDFCKATAQNIESSDGWKHWLFQPTNQYGKEIAISRHFEMCPACVGALVDPSDLGIFRRLLAWCRSKPRA